MAATAPAAPKAACRSWADVARGTPGTAAAGDAKPLPSVSAEVEQEPLVPLADDVCAGAKTDCRSWGSLAQCMVSAFSSADEEEDEDFLRREVAGIEDSSQDEEEAALPKGWLLLPAAPTRPATAAKPAAPVPRVHPHPFPSARQASKAKPWRNMAQRMATALAHSSADGSFPPAMSGPEWDPEEDLSVALAPEPRGEKKCRCQGEVLIMFSKYGWLTTNRRSSRIDHPSATKNGGRIYVNRQDIVSDIALVEGDQVCFYLYVDEQGLGAEELRLQHWDSTRLRAPKSMNPGAAEFVPALRYVKPPTPAPIHPQRFSMAAPKDVFEVNLSYWSDDSDSDVDTCGDATPTHATQAVGALAMAGGASRIARKSKTHSWCGSSSTGTPSDSEMCVLDSSPPGLDSKRCTLDCLPPGLESVVRVLDGPPPGIEADGCARSSHLPPGLTRLVKFRPPPGLSLLPSEERIFQ